MAKQHQVRIIGGHYRGRRLSVPSVLGLRPTADRVRETLFNWLTPVIAGSRCLDLFAGTGALGFEAASRGAEQVWLLDRSAKVIQQLEQHCQTLGATNVQIIQADAVDWLNKPAPVAFDLVFLDPPFTAELLVPCCHRLATTGWLKRDAWIYLEASSHAPWPELPSQWQFYRQKEAGQVRYALMQAGALVRG